MDWIDPASLRRVAAAYDRYADEAAAAVAKLPTTYLKDDVLGDTEIGVATIKAFRTATWEGDESFYARVMWQVDYARALATEFRRQATVFENQDRGSAEAILRASDVR